VKDMLKSLGGIKFLFIIVHCPLQPMTITV